MLIQIKLTQIGNSIKVQLPCKMHCKVMENEITNNFTLPKDDLIIQKLNLKQSDFKKRKSILKKVDLSDLGYDPCDSPRINYIK